MRTLNKNTLLVFLMSIIFGSVNGQAQDWQLSGNGSTSPVTDYLGTSDNTDLVIRTNATERLRITGAGGINIASGGNLGIGLTAPNYLLDINTGDLNLTDGIIRIGDEEMVLYDATANNFTLGTSHSMPDLGTGGDNLFVGFNAGLSIENGTNNIFIGDESGQTLDQGDRNVFIGNESGATADDVNDNVYVGHLSGRLNESSRNVFVGSGTGASASGSEHSVMIGFNAGNATTTGDDNVFVGFEAGASNVTAANNVFIGNQAGTSNTTATNNVFLGSESGLDNTTGSDNLFIGRSAGENNTEADKNIFLGTFSGRFTTTGNENIYIGYESGLTGVTAENNTFLGFRSGRLNTGNNNVFVGFWSGLNNTTAGGNTYLGYRSARNNQTGGNNTILGHCAGENLNGGGNNTIVGNIAGSSLNNDVSNDLNVIIGNGAMREFVGCATGNTLTLVGAAADACNGTTGLSNASAFGYQAKVEADNSLVLGSIAGVNDADFSTNVGIGTTTPDSRLEVVQGTAGQSGLRLTSLAGSTAGSANGEVLSIDSNGDVILVEDGGAGFGNLCSATPEPLAGNYQLDFNDYNLYFTGSSTYSGTGVNTNGIGIGVACGGDVFGKLYIVQDQATFNNGSQDQALGATVNVTNTTAGDGVAIVGLSRAVRSNKNIGGDFYSGNAATINVGVEAKSRGTDGPSDINYGGLFFAEDADENIGVYGEASNGDTTGVGDWAGYFNGNVAATGVYYSLSDQTLKRDIVPLTSASEKLSQLNPVRYNFRTEQYPTINLSPRNQIGLLAQEVEQVVPQAVGNVSHPAQYDEEGNQVSDRIDLKGVNYTQLIPLLIAGFNEQQTQNAELNNRLQQLEQQVQQLQDCIDQSRLCVEPQQRLSGEDEQSVVLENQSAIILDQNVPNPFAEQTRISFSIPEEVVNAEMIFFDMNGVIINQVQLVDRGNGSITVYGENLSSGVYSYSLVADGQVIATKNMVKN